MHSRFQTALTALAADLRAAIAPMLADPHFPALLEADQVMMLQQATGLSEDALALALLPLAAACTRVDLSHFNVGTIARGISDRWYLNDNMEFLDATMQQTVHAEQGTINHTWLRDETPLHVVTVSCTPCGHCRRFMNELSSGLALRIHLPGRETHTLGHYPPGAFGPKDLEIRTLPMDTQDHSFPMNGDALIQATIQAANCCHASYSHSPSGVTLELKDGTIFSDSCAENAAFNPTLPPLQGVLNLLSLNGCDHPAIQRAILAEKADAALIQWDATVATLRALGCQNIERVLLG